MCPDELGGQPAARVTVIGPDGSVGTLEPGHDGVVRLERMPDRQYRRPACARERRWRIETDPALCLSRTYGFIDGEPFPDDERSTFNRFLHLRL